MMHLRMRSILVDVVLVAAWAASTGMVVLHERGAFWGVGVNPMTLLRAPAEVNEQWFGLYYQGQQIGYTHTMLLPEERRGVPGVSVIDRGRLSVTLLGMP